MPHLDHIETAARRKLGESDKWKGFSFEAVSGDYIVIGAIPIRYVSKGKHKGRPIWKGAGIKIIVTEADVQAEINRYTTETGNCPDCFGTKEEFKSWSIKDGLKKRQCSTCCGSGTCVPALIKG